VLDFDQPSNPQNRGHQSSASQGLHHHHYLITIIFTLIASHCRLAVVASLHVLLTLHVQLSPPASWPRQFPITSTYSSVSPIFLPHHFTVFNHMTSRRLSHSHSTPLPQFCKFSSPHHLLLLIAHDSTPFTTIFAIAAVFPAFILIRSFRNM
jgi:hypothetical protein